MLQLSGTIGDIVTILPHSCGFGFCCGVWGGLGVVLGGFGFVGFFTPEHTLSALSLPFHFLLYWDGEKQS